MRVLAGLALAASLYAQSQIQILADKTRLVAGEQLQLTAIARDAAGNVRRGEVISWTTNPVTSPVATVGSTGMGSRVTSTPAKMRAVSAMPGNRSLITAGPRCSRCRWM